MIGRRRLMMGVASRAPVQHYKDMDSLWLTPTIALSNDLDKDIDSLGLNVGITLETV